MNHREHTPRLQTGHPPRRLGYVFLVVACLLAAMTSPASAEGGFPEPDLVPRSWELEFVHEPIKAIAVSDVEGRIRWFWYMLYTVRNETGQDRLWIPEVTIATSEGDIVAAGQNVPATVYQAIREREQRMFLLSPIEVVGRIMQGDDFIKESVAIWPAFEHDIDDMTIFIAGISGETKPYIVPDTGERIVLRKTLMIPYRMPGKPEHKQNVSLEPVEPAWVMR